MNSRLVNFLDKHNILTRKQFGFRKNHSTSHAICNLVGEIVSGFEKNFNCIALFLDIKKAFDSCNHGIILSKLEHYGIRGLALDWFNSYLTNRRQFVEHNKCVSDECEVDIGIPQGTILGPILMSIMNNDLQACLKLGNCILFADDTTIFLLGGNIRFLFAKMQREIDLVSSWF